MNKHSDVLISFLESLRSQTEIFAEDTANRKSSTSLEDLVQETLLQNGFQDLSLELENCHRGLPNFFSQASTKSARKKQYNRIKEYINNYGTLSNAEIRQDLEEVFPKNCFIRHPNGAQNHIDFLIIINGYMLYWEIKTGGGLSGKLNDKPIPAQFFVLMCSRHKTVKASPFTWFQMADLMNNETYNFYETIMSKYTDYIKEIRSVAGYTTTVAKYASQPSLRGILGWGKDNNDWYRKTCNGMSRAEREQYVINILKGL